MKTNTKIFLINLVIFFVGLTLLHWVSQLIWTSDPTPFFRLIVAGLFAKAYPLYKPKEKEKNQD